MTQLQCSDFFLLFLILGKENSMFYEIYAASCYSIDLLCMSFEAFNLIYVMFSLCIEVCANNGILY